MKKEFQVVLCYFNQVPALGNIHIHVPRTYVHIRMQDVQTWYLRNGIFPKFLSDSGTHNSASTADYNITTLAKHTRP